MEKDLFIYEDLIECCSDMLAFGAVTFVRHFGPVNKGDYFELVAIMLDLGEIHIETDEGKRIHTIPFSLTPKA